MSHIEIQRRREEAEAHIRTTVMNELCEVMHRTGLPPMAVLRMAARSLGTIYREMAEAHSGPDTCSCGWRPQMAADMELLSLTLTMACERRAVDDLARMRIAGSA